jgi:hypothetical protein
VDKFVGELEVEDVLGHAMMKGGREQGGQKGIMEELKKYLIPMKMSVLLFPFRVCVCPGLRQV